MSIEKFFYEYHSDNSNHAYFTHSYGGPCIAHFHMATEIIGVIEGHLEIIVNNESYTLHKGEIAVIPTAAVHTYKCSEKNENYVLTVSQNILQQFKKDYPKSFDFFLPKGAYTEKIFETFAWFEKHWVDSNYPMRYGMINFFFGLLAKAYPPAKEFTKKSFFYSDILLFIEEHLFENLTLEMIADHFGYSKNYFSAMFNKAIGMHLKDYINRLRLQKATARLENAESKETVLKIALDCGFNSVNTFYRALNRFKDKELESPSYQWMQE